MADVDNKWSLFGLDLSRSGGWVALGVHQLMCDPGAWLLKRFDPSIRVIQGGEALLYRADTPLCKAFAADEQTPFSAVALSVDAVLFKTLHLPSSTSILSLSLGLPSLSLLFSLPFSSKGLPLPWW